ncbi:Hypothetical protein PHPALM_16793 [Phytophthora palmivora]|uniref:Uncharacterized protein n=1 Tax=Phytophthora palmivora TaxID=4796 RepID=A0A2P4XNY0_9STRA|nr:Hypothetical protein PHPALM_16793 [Phytophthora palmivora]
MPSRPRISCLGDPKPRIKRSFKHEYERQHLSFRAVNRLTAAESATTVAKALGVHRSSLYGWKKQERELKAANTPNKCYVGPSSRASLAIRHPALEKRLLDWIVDMRKDRSLCVSTMFTIDDVEVLSAALTQPVTACEPHVYPPILKTKPFDYQENNS